MSVEEVMNGLDVQCGNCGQFMQVGGELAGQTVRCPYCQQATQAPLPDNELAPDMDFGARAGREEMQAADMGSSSSNPFSANLPAPSPDGPDSVSEMQALGGEAPFPSKSPAATSGGAGSFGNILPLLLIPLISYAILATIAILVLLSRSPPDPLEQLLDLEGDYKGGSRQKQGSLHYERTPPDSPLPSRLQVALGKPIQVGELEIVPLQVEWRKVVFEKPGFAPEPALEESLVLQLALRNISSDSVFCPTDPYFERRWKTTDTAARKPYSFLQVGEQRFYGGPIVWDRTDTRLSRERIRGQHHKMLNPGESVQTFVCSDPDQHWQASLAKAAGAAVWRIQVRRGLVRRADRDYSLTAVVGVVFDLADIGKGTVLRTEKSG